MGYRPGDRFTIERFYIVNSGKGVCLHALASMLTLLSPLLKGLSAKVMGIGIEDSIGYIYNAQIQESRTLVEVQ